MSNQVYVDIETFKREIEEATLNKCAYIVHGEFKDVPMFFEEWSSIKTPKYKDVYYQFVVNGSKESMFEIWEGGSFLKGSGYPYKAINRHILGTDDHESVTRSGLQAVDIKGATRVSFKGSANEIFSKGTGDTPTIVKLKRDTLYLFHSFSFENNNTISFRAEFYEKD